MLNYYQLQLPTYPRCTLHEDFGKLLAEHQFCDVQFVVGYNEVKLPAHIAIVAARSPVLKDKIMYAMIAHCTLSSRAFN